MVSDNVLSKTKENPKPRKIDELLDDWKNPEKMDGVAEELSNRHPYISILMILHGLDTEEIRREDIFDLSLLTGQDYNDTVKDEYGEGG